MRRGHRRCVCGRSGTFPLCDGSHADARWRCEPPAATVPVVVAAGHHLVSVGERLASHLRGVAAHHLTEDVRSERVIVLSDGGDVDALRVQVARVQADQRLVIAVDAPASAVAAAWGGWAVSEAAAGEPTHLWRAVLGALDQRVEPQPLGRAFLSHAVADEARIQPAVDYLRSRLGADLFLCADSLGSGSDWRLEIERGLDAAETFVLLASAASAQSTWCAFETGYAAARGVRQRMVLLDDHPPPPWLAHIQATDLPRTLRRRPWLSPEEALVDALLEAVAR